MENLSNEREKPSSFGPDICYLVVVLSVVVSSSRIVTVELLRVRLHCDFCSCGLFVILKSMIVDDSGLRNLAFPAGLKEDLL